MNSHKSHRNRGSCKSYNLLSSYKPDNRHYLALDTKESVCSAGDWAQSLGQEDPLEKGMATHCSILAWRTIWTEEHGITRVRYDLATEL